MTLQTTCMRATYGNTCPLSTAPLRYPRQPSSCATSDRISRSDQNSIYSVYYHKQICNCAVSLCSKQKSFIKGVQLYALVQVGIMGWVTELIGGVDIKTLRRHHQRGCIREGCPVPSSVLRNFSYPQRTVFWACYEYNKPRQNTRKDIETARFLL